MKHAHGHIMPQECVCCNLLKSKTVPQTADDSPVGKLTSNEFGFLPTANETSARSNDLVSCEAPKKTFFASMCKISAASPTSVVVAFKSEPKEISFKADPFLFHSRSIANPSFDELMFLACLSEFGPELSMRLPATLHWKCQRPLRALRAVMNELDRNCSGQSAKRKPLSGSPAVSRKRSSGA